MAAPALQAVNLPIAGMTCAACANRIEKTLNRLPGVAASVNFASEYVRIEFDRARVRSADLVQAIEKAGYSVPPQTAEFALEGMTCAACAARIEKALNRMAGVEAHVNFAAERARVRYDPGKTDIAALVTAVGKAGYAARPVTDFDDAEERRRHELAYHATLREFWIAAVLTA